VTTHQTTSANNEHPLAQMRPLHLPEAIDFWPLAPGWYVVFVLLLVTIIGLTLFFLNKKRKTLFKRQATKELHVIRSRLASKESSPQETAQALSSLLKRLALSHFPRENISPLNGEVWLSFLNSLFSSNFFSENEGKLLGEALFDESFWRKEDSEQSLKKVIDKCESLIKNFNVEQARLPEHD
jgi:hypothetical protein